MLLIFVNKNDDKDKLGSFTPQVSSKESVSDFNSFHRRHRILFTLWILDTEIKVHFKMNSGLEMNICLAFLLIG
jgi:hypothetical protein